MRNEAVDLQAFQRPDVFPLALKVVVWVVARIACPFTAFDGYLGHLAESTFSF